MNFLNKRIKQLKSDIQREKTKKKADRSPRIASWQKSLKTVRAWREEIAELEKKRAPQRLAALGFVERPETEVVAADANALIFGRPSGEFTADTMKRLKAYDRHRTEARGLMPSSWITEFTEIDPLSVADMQRVKDRISNKSEFLKDLVFTSSNTKSIDLDEAVLATEKLRADLMVFDVGVSVAMRPIEHNTILTYQDL